MSGSVGALRGGGQRCNYTACQHQACRGRRTGVVWAVSNHRRAFSVFSTRYGHGFEMFCLASDGAAATVVASACKVGGAKPVGRLLNQ